MALTDTLVEGALPGSRDSCDTNWSFNDRNVILASKYIFDLDSVSTEGRWLMAPASGLVITRI